MSEPSVCNAHADNTPANLRVADDLVITVADILARYPCRASGDVELDGLRRFEVARHIAAVLRAQAIEAGTDETRNAAQPEGRERGPKGAPK